MSAVQVAAASAVNGARGMVAAAGCTGTPVECALQKVDDDFYTYVLSALLVIVGLYFTVRTRGVQLRHFGTMMRTIVRSRSGAEGGISSFQAFAVGLAARVGIGNVAGVALAVVAGGPGALFWMWVVAVIGMATAFVESTLAQVFKERGRDLTFHGGPAYYIKNGLGSRVWSAVFAGLCIISVGVTVVMVQTNSLAGVINATVPEVAPWMVGVALVLLTAPIVLGGLKSVARVTEWIAPLMALVYLLVALVVLLLNLADLPRILSEVVRGAFGADQALYGVAGGMTAAVINGNYAMDFGFKLEDAIFRDTSLNEKPYWNLVAARTADLEDPAKVELYGKVIKAFRSEATKAVLDKMFGGYVVSAGWDEDFLAPFRK